ncbi:8-amino-7-oxononanoate synthase [Cyanobacterium stanieri LEGE 03274]|uniref:8-amino-7-ketopelargonate synthase n=1 Tax=Cyanobacterium stanieri LEGE 03274 TaxID=1828756 RepID=A0ABR9V445_9CHRO|nr:8-amino-7-oxononanoate synthase [Cyanobacterium stanieri]MBE9222675.1 8-amino-7-oxononanoate synthase [Cyanobacterium stanieri LEGE 03274]
MNDSLGQHLQKSLSTIKKARWYRQEQKITDLSGYTITIDGEQLINFASNDYLGLATDIRLKQAVIEATERYGNGSTGSRLLSGHRTLHDDLEGAIASLKQTPKALVFSSGYLANLGTISALMGKKDLILGDEYNHSSLKNGAKLSQASILEYQHLNCEDLVDKLNKNRANHRHCLIITDSVFSMDGDIAPLPELLDIAQKFDCWLMVDEAHGTGVMGKQGAGCLEHFGLKNERIIQIGTLSKAVGSLGGYVAGSEILIDFLRNRCPTWIYTTALSIPDTAAALTGIHIIRTEAHRRHNLWTNINLLKKLCNQANLTLLPSDSAILCLPLKDASEALFISSKLRDNGFYIPAIRPPTVPTSRLRLSIMATHNISDLQKLIGILGKSCP